MRAQLRECEQEYFFVGTGSGTSRKACRIAETGPDWKEKRNRRMQKEPWIVEILRFVVPFLCAVSAAACRFMEGLESGWSG